MVFRCPLMSQDMSTREHSTPVAARKVTGSMGYFPNKMRETENARIPIDILKSVLKRLK